MSDASSRDRDTEEVTRTSEGDIREHLLARALVELADTLVADFDVVELLTVLADRCVEVFDVSAAGLMLVVAPQGRLRAVASSSEAIHVLELFEEQSEEGPCPDCHRTGVRIVNQELTTGSGLWPNFGPRALAAGFHSVHALPMHLRGVTIGALNLFCDHKRAMREADIAAAQALADIATIAILQNRRISEALVVNHQLQGALDSRVAIEQAKGIVAERSHCTMERAFSSLRSYARSHNRRLADVAAGIVDGSLKIETLPPPSNIPNAPDPPNTAE